MAVAQDQRMDLSRTYRGSFNTHRGVNHVSVVIPGSALNIDLHPRLAQKRQAAFIGVGAKRHDPADTFCD